MIFFREEIEKNEEKILASYATFSKNSKWRKVEEKEDQFRTCFQRDKDRILHTKSYRRLDWKTQVFSAQTKSDHARNRLLHTNEVEQISKTLAKILGLNEDLAEVLAKSHDLGHTPYGHIGQDVLNECLSKHWLSFEHNLQSKRIVEHLEQRSLKYEWLNLSHEVLVWLGKHDEKKGYEKWALPYLEAQAVNIADAVAYLSADTEDGLRSGILKFKDLENLKIWKRVKEKIKVKKIVKRNLRRAIWNLIKIMVEDLVLETEKNLKKEKIKTQKDVENYKKVLVKFSENFYLEVKELKTLLFEKFYRSEKVMKQMEKWSREIKLLFDFYLKNPDKIKSKYKIRIKEDGLPRCVADLISGMTDKHAREKARRVGKLRISKKD